MEQLETQEPKMELMKPDDTSLMQMERASIDSQIATAKQYPRTLSKVKADMLSFATLDEETAAACFYTLPRGNKQIQGKSVRLAEIAVSCYGNLRAGTRVVSEVIDGPTPHVVIQAVCHDLEKNTAVQIEKRRRVTKKKFKESPDEDDIQLAVNAGSSIAFRDAVFKVIPNALTNPVMEAAKRVAVGDVKSLAVKRDQVISRLKQMGVTQERILAVVDVPKIEDITIDKLETLIGLGTAIKDGATTLEEAFPNVKPKAPSIVTAPAAQEQPQAQPVAKTEEVTQTATVQPEELPNLDDPAEALKQLMTKNGISEDQVMAFAKAQKLVRVDQDSIGKLSPPRIRSLCTDFSKIVAFVKEQK